MSATVVRGDDRVVDVDRLTGLTVAALFAGIGGIELGLHGAGHRTAAWCEADPGAAAVLRSRFQVGESLHADVADMDELGCDVDWVAAGFPCQDLSQAGRTAGIEGRAPDWSDTCSDCSRRRRSIHRGGCCWRTFRSCCRSTGARRCAPHRRADELGYRWAYRVVDTRAFGLPQRRQRVLLLASRDGRPAARSLLAEDAGPTGRPRSRRTPRAASTGPRASAVSGWPSTPSRRSRAARRSGSRRRPRSGCAATALFTPDLRDAERLQGFPADWTAPAVASGRRTGRPLEARRQRRQRPRREWLGRPPPRCPPSTATRWT